MTKLIGDRREKSALDEMEEVARQRNKDVAEEDRLEALVKSDEPKAEEPITNTPDDIISEIEAKIGKEGELYRMVPKNDELSTRDNALMALYFAITGNKGKADKIAAEIEKRIEKNAGLYVASNKKGSGNWFWKSLKENAAMALYFAITGNKGKAGDIVLAIESQIGREGVLYAEHAGSERICKEGNATMALYFATAGKISDAEDIVSGIEAISGKYNEMYTTPNSTDLWTSINAEMALYFLITGNREKAERIASGIESKIGRNGKLYRLFKEDTTSLWLTPSALMCLYFAVKAGAKLEAK